MWHDPERSSSHLREDLRNRGNEQALGEERNNHISFPRKEQEKFAKLEEAQKALDMSLSRVPGDDKIYISG